MNARGGGTDATEARFAGSRLALRLRAQMPAKLGVWIGLAIGICVPYFGLQQLELFPAYRLAPTVVDRAVPFAPGWIWPYVSIALLVAITPLLAPTRDALRRYSAGLAMLCATCFAVFLFFPVEGPRPAALPAEEMYRLIVSVDRPTNSLPSLHVGLVVYSLLVCERLLRRDVSPATLAALRTVGLAWGAAILYSTLATKQHWAVDLPPAIAIAWAAYAVAWRRAD